MSIIQYIQISGSLIQHELYIGYRIFIGTTQCVISDRSTDKTHYRLTYF